MEFNNYEAGKKESSKMKLLGFRSNKLWKKILSVIYLVAWSVSFFSLVGGGPLGRVSESDFMIEQIQSMIIFVVGITPYIFLSETKLRQRLPLFKEHKRSKSIIGLIFVVIILLAVQGMLNPLHSKEYLADQANHDYRMIDTTEATCEEEGEIHYVCDYCGQAHYEYPEALGHSMKELSKSEATCETDGVIMSKCSVCGLEEESTVPALGHDMKEINRTEPTEENDGAVTKRCERCGYEELEIMKTNTEEGIVEESKSELDNNQDKNENRDTNIEELPIYSFEYLNAYIEINDINIPKGGSKNKIEKALENDSEMISLKRREMLWGEGVEYTATVEQTELQYVGEMKDNKPHGWGRIMKLVSATEYEDEQGVKLKFGEYSDAQDYLDVYIVLLYVGEFKNGSYDGYGWEYITPYTSGDDLANSYYSRDLGYDYVRVEKDIQQNILNTCNPIGYMGEFSKGVYQGEGIMIQYPIREIPIGMTVSEQESLYGARLDREIVFYVSEYKNGQRNGKCKEYMFGKLLYDGTIESGTYNKKGILYYAGTEQKKYDGEWRTGYYHGKGTLYNEDGSIKYKGEWDMGDYAN